MIWEIQASRTIEKATDASAFFPFRLFHTSATPTRRGDTRRASPQLRRIKSCYSDGGVMEGCIESEHAWHSEVSKAFDS